MTQYTEPTYNRATFDQDSRSVQILARILAKAQNGSLTLISPSGDASTFRGPKEGPEVTLHLKSTKAVRRYIFGGAVGFAEAYLEGEWECSDLTELLRYAVMNKKAFEAHFKGNWAVVLLANVMKYLRRNNKSGSKKNIHAHYDLGNGFYELWLDPTMTYSSALFDHQNEDLTAAQYRKYDKICENILAAPDKQILEIGSGWGGFARHCAKTRGSHVTTVTISQEQFDHTSRLVQQEGLNEQIDVRLMDYRDIQGKFDGIASIEMFEAVGEAYWADYFNKLKSSLTPEGRASLQIITIAEADYPRYKTGMDFIQRYIFPGGFLPSPSALTNAVNASGLEVERTHTFGQSYAETLRRWRDSFEEAWPRIEPMGFDDRFRRMWRYYLAYCEAGFSENSIDVGHYTLKHSG